MKLGYSMSCDEGDHIGYEVICVIGCYFSVKQKYWHPPQGVCVCMRERIKWKCNRHRMCFVLLCLLWFAYWMLFLFHKHLESTGLNIYPPTFTNGSCSCILFWLESAISNPRNKKKKLWNYPFLISKESLEFSSLVFCSRA